MADETLTFTTQNIGGEKLIRVDKKVVQLEEGDTLEFTNSLTGNPDVVVQFYGLGSTTPVSGFCAEASGDQFPVPGNGSAVCTLAQDADAFAYTAVTAPGTPPGKQHLELDPVIIITPAKSLSLQFLTSPPGIIAEVLVLVLLAVAYRVGVSTGMKKGATRAG